MRNPPRGASLRGGAGWPVINSGKSFQAVGAFNAGFIAASIGMVQRTKTLQNLDYATRKRIGQQK